jgi:hypothetical protein
MQRLIISIILSVFTLVSYAQQDKPKGVLSGNLQLDGAYYTDSLSQELKPEGFGINTYANFNYTYGKFSAGVRYEIYQPPMVGYDDRFKGSGIPYKYLTYRADELEFTVGNFYEQFGSGMVLRAYEEKMLGLDNALEGVQVKYNPYQGVFVKGLVARQRNYWDTEGLIRGIDGEFVINDIFKFENMNLPYISVGGNFVSKYQDPEHSTLVLPANVALGSGRMSIVHKGFNLSGEYAYKANDPSADNNFTYNNGHGILINATYSRKGFGVFLSAKRLDNMFFRSDRNASGTNFLINNPPAIAQEHTYSLAAMYPFATQANGEMGLQGQVSYKIKKKSLLGGKYGTKLTLTYSVVKDIKRDSVDNVTAIGEKGTYGYKSDITKVGDQWYTDINLKISKKFSKKFKGSLMHMYQEFDNNIFTVGNYHGLIEANISVVDMTYKLNKKNAVRIELQHMAVGKDHHDHSHSQDNGNWAMAMVEYTVSPHWFFVVWDQWNYGNDVKDSKVHFYNFSFGYTRNANRITLAYGKQREGVVCAGGVCRFVPAFEGLMLNITSTF